MKKSDPSSSQSPDMLQEDLFIDSGAWSLFKRHVLKAHKKSQPILGKHGRPLEKPVVISGSTAGDFSFYSLKKGSEFRAYCDSYAAFMRAFAGRISWFANVDAIGNPEITWKIQLYFEEEHGLKPVPVVHFGADLNWLRRYLERGYDMIGLGGFARRPPPNQVINWCDQAFMMVCPASNKYLPQVKVHGFALTAFTYMSRWPWFSVDSSSFLCPAKYGVVYVPPWSKAEERFRFDIPPYHIGVSYFLDNNGTDSDQDLTSIKSCGGGSHFERRFHVSQIESLENKRAQVMRWLKHIGLSYKQMEEDQKYRRQANLRYFMELEALLPQWPWPLDPKIVEKYAADYLSSSLINT